MAVRDIFKVSRKTFFNPSGWLDYQAVKTQTSTMFNIILTLFTPPKPQVTETFEESVKRQHLTENDLISIHSRYRRFTAFFIIMGVAGFSYSFYLLFAHHTFLGFLLGLGVTALFFAYAFRFDFWAYQIRNRKLGVSFDEWLRAVLGN